MRKFIKRHEIIGANGEVRMYWHDSQRTDKFQYLQFKISSYFQNDSLLIYTCHLIGPHKNGRSLIVRGQSTEHELAETPFHHLRVLQPHSFLKVLDWKKELVSINFSQIWLFSFSVKWVNDVTMVFFRVYQNASFWHLYGKFSNVAKKERKRAWIVNASL